MTAIANSSAIRDETRVLSQHQVALTVLKLNLLGPESPPVRWLDLACGRGQILRHLADSVSAPERKRLHYYGYDVEQDYARETERHASTLELASFNTEVGELRSFSTAFPSDRAFDFLTLTNTLHEVSIREIPQLLVECILRLSPKGLLYVYDMETLKPLELGAVPWKAEEMTTIVGALFQGLGCDAIDLVQSWRHSSTKAWSISLPRDRIPFDQQDLVHRRTDAVNSLTASISSLVESKFLACKKALDTLTRYGPETPEEEQQLISTLYDFWALSRAREVPQ